MVSCKLINTSFHQQIEFKEYEIQTSKLQVRFLNYGGIITKIAMAEDQFNQNLVLAFNHYDDYLINDCYLNTLVGRTANRIKNGTFTLKNQRYVLDLNNGVNNLHGGHQNLSHALFDVVEIENGYELSTTLPHQEQGFPGNLQSRITYEVVDQTLNITFSATTDQDTIANFTHHLYVNLSGDLHQNVLNHHLQIHADKIATVDENSSFTTEFLNVLGTCFDFNSLTQIDPSQKVTHEQLQFTNGYDHLYILSKHNQAATVIDPISKRRLVVSTSLPSLQFYAGNFLTPQHIFEHNRRGEAHLGLALEAHFIPFDYQSQHLTPTDVYQETVSFTFSQGE